MTSKVSAFILFLFFQVWSVSSQPTESPFVEDQRFFPRQELNGYLEEAGKQLHQQLKYDFNSIEFLFNAAGKNYNDQRNLEKATFYLKIAHDISVFINDQEGISVTCGGIASIYLLQGKYREALILCKKTVSLHEQLNAVGYLGTSYHNLCSIYHSLGNYDQALIECFKAKDIQEKGKDEIISLSRTYNTIGVIYSDLGQYQEALLWCNKSRKIREKLNLKKELGITYNTIGYTYSLRGNYQEALSWYFKTEAIQKELGLEMDLAHTYNNIGATYRSQGFYDKALIWCQKAEIIVEELGQQAKLAKTYNNIGTIYEAKEDYSKALSWYEKARIIREELGLEVDLTMAYNNIAGVYHRLAQYDKALYFSQKAIDIQERLGLDVFLATSYNTMGSIYNTQGKYSLAMLWYSKTKNLREKLKLELGLSTAYNNLASVQQSIGFSKEALYYLHKARNIQEKLSSKVLLAITYNNLANIFFKTNVLDSTLFYAQASILIHEELRNLNRGQIDRQVYLSKTQPALELGLSSAFELIKYDTAFILSEKAKARGLTDLLAEKSIQLEKLPEGLDTVYQSVRSQLIAINQSISTDILPEKRKNLLETRDRLFKEKKTLEDQIKTIAPAFANLVYPETVNHHQIQNVLRDHEVMISYFTESESTYAFIISGAKFEMLNLGSTDSLKVLVEQFREGFLQNQRNAIIKGDRLQGRQAQEQFFEIASQLYQKLWPLPAATALLEGKEIVIIPDGFLNFLPFELLIEDQNMMAYKDYHYLIKKHPISYYPSATVFHFQRTTKTKKSNPKQDFLGIAISDFHSNFCYEDNSQFFASLPLNDEEVAKIASNFADSRILKGEDTKESTLKTMDLTSYRYLHFATHGLINTENPDFSRILLSPSQEDDGCLNLYEIFNLKLNADLVSLSACETGLGKLIQGEGMVGFTHAFMYAGTSSLMLSLWEVTDRSTQKLFTDFYEKLSKKNKNKYTPLRHAQLQMIEQGGEYANPYYWAPFIFIGEKLSKESNQACYS